MFEDDVFGPIPDIIDLGDLKQKPLSPRLDPNAHPVTPYSTAASAPATEWWVAMFILTPSQNGFFLTSNFFKNFDKKCKCASDFWAKKIAILKLWRNFEKN